MATVVYLKHPQTGLVKKGFLGFSWSTFFGSGIPALSRGDFLTGIILLATCWMGLLPQVIWAFFYNKRYTLKLLQQGYVFADAEATVSLAKQKLGIFQ